MTDFTRTIPISVTPEQPIDQALEQMRLRGVRYLLVVAETQVVGSITSYDIEGGRRLNFLQRSAGTRLGPICVGDIMTEWEDLPTMDWPTVQAVRVADLVEIFRGVDVMHLLVVEEEVCRDGTLVRGLISRTRVDRRLDRGGQASHASRGAQGVRD